MHRCLPSCEGEHVVSNRQANVYSSRPAAGPACRPTHRKTAKAAHFTGRHQGAATSTLLILTPRWAGVAAPPLLSNPSARGLHALHMLLAVIVRACGRVVWKHSGQCHIKPAEQSTSNLDESILPHTPKEFIVASRTGSKSGGLAATDFATPKQGLDEVRVPPATTTLLLLLCCVTQALAGGDPKPQVQKELFVELPPEPKGTEAHPTKKAASGAAGGGGSEAPFKGGGLQALQGEGGGVAEGVEGLQEELEGGFQGLEVVKQHTQKFNVLFHSTQASFPR